MEPFVLGQEVITSNGFKGRVWVIDGNTNMCLIRQEDDNGKVVLSKWTSQSAMASIPS